MSDKILYNPFEAMTFSQDRCFLCGCEFTTQNPKTEEHVFPKWLQREYNLWDERINLLNNTATCDSAIQYKNYKIPCCRSCNGIYLQQLENEIREKALQGYDAFIKLEDIKIFQWIAKIYYGIYFKELFLKSDRKNKDSENILTPNFMERFRMLHSFLQSVRIPFEFETNKPWSIFLFKTSRYCVS